MKRRIRRRIILLAIVFLTTGCVRQELNYKESQISSSPETTLTFFGYKYEALSVQAIETSLHDYMNLLPEITITYESIKGTAYYDALLKRVANGYTDDIFMVDQASTKELAQQGVLADLSDLSTIDNFNELAKSQMIMNGEIRYVPTSISAFGLYCNEELLEKHHQKIPQNLEEFKAVCSYFVEKGITPIVANNDISLKTIVLAKRLFDVYQDENPQEMIKQFNTGERDLTKQLEPGFALVEMMIDKQYIDTNEALNTKKTQDDLEIFAKGERPFMLTGAWAATRLKDLNPNLSFSVYPYPILEDGSVMVVNIDTRVAVNAKGEHVEEAKAFVEYITQKDVMRDFAKSIDSFIPCNDKQDLHNPAIEPMEAYMQNKRSVIGSDDNLIYPIWNLTRESVVDMLKGKSREETLKQLDEKLQKVREEGDYEK